MTFLGCFIAHVFIFRQPCWYLLDLSPPGCRRRERRGGTTNQKFTHWPLENENKTYNHRKLCTNPIYWLFAVCQIWKAPHVPTAVACWVTRSWHDLTGISVRWPGTSSVPTGVILQPRQPKFQPNILQPKRCRKLAEKWPFFGASRQPFAWLGRPGALRSHAGSLDRSGQLPNKNDMFGYHNWVGGRILTCP